MQEPTSSDIEQHEQLSTRNLKSPFTSTSSIPAINSIESIKTKQKVSMDFDERMCIIII